MLGDGAEGREPGGPVDFGSVQERVAGGVPVGRERTVSAERGGGGDRNRPLIQQLLVAQTLIASFAKAQSQMKVRAREIHDVRTGVQPQLDIRMSRVQIGEPWQQ